MAPSVKELSTELVKFFGNDGPFWSASMYRFTAFGGGGLSRTIIVKDGMAQFASVLPPYYGFPHPLNPNIDTEITAVANNSDPNGVMTGTVEIKEAYYREGTDEFSWVGADSIEVNIGETPSSVNVTSNSYNIYDRNITHRVFFVKYESLGVYYEGGRCPYTAETDASGAGDTCNINVTAERIINNRELPNQAQTRIFPATLTGTFWKGRVFGACLEPRDFKSGTKLRVFDESNVVVIDETSPGSEEYPDFFYQSDHYKGVVDRDTGQILFYIEQVINNVTAYIRIPGDLEDKSIWHSPDNNESDVFDNVGLTGDLAKIYATPIYAGGPGGSIVYGIMSFNALDVLEDESFYASGAKLVKLVNAGDDLAVIYDRGIGFFTGDVSAGAPPTCRHFALARDVGTISPDSVWQRPDGSVWFVGNKRLYTIQSGQCVEVSKAMGVSALWDKYTENYGKGQREFQAAYNAMLDMGLIVNVPKKGEGTGEYGTYGLAVCHDANTVNPVRWPVALTSIGCLQHDDGQHQFYGGAKSGGWLYKLMKPGKLTDDYYDGDDTLVTAQPIEWSYLTGTQWEEGIVYPAGVRFLVETTAQDGVNLTLEADLKTGNLVSPEFSADVVHQISHSKLNRYETFPLHKKGGYAVQYKVSGLSSRDIILVGMRVSEEYRVARGTTSDY